MPKRKRPSKWKMVLVILLLAILCIGGVELAVCRVMDPVLFERIVAPVKEQWKKGKAQWEQGTGELLAAGERWWESMQPEEPPEEQRMGEPDITTDMGVADESLTKIVADGGKELLTGGNRIIRYYNQTDPAWSDRPYGSDSIGGYGCGPTAMAMAVSSMTQQAIDPAQMAQWARDQHYWAKGHGSYLSIVEGVANAYGLRVSSLADIDAERLRQELASGKILVALMTKGHFTQGGHFILLRGVTLDGGVLVADPSSRERSLMVWDAQLILDELSKSRHNGAPLWSLAPLESKVE